MRIIFETEFFKEEGLKVLINISTNEPSSRNSIAKECATDIKNDFKTSHQNQSTIFLLTRLLFLLSIDYEGARELSADSGCIEVFIQESFDNFSPNASGEYQNIIIDILRYRYNIIRHDLKDYKEYRFTILFC